MKPPRTPAETLRRVIRLARMDGLSVLIIAGVLGLASVALGDFGGGAVGFIVAAAGAIELRGAALLKAARPQGLRWLIASQLYLLTVILGYVAFRVTHPESDPILGGVISATKQVGMDMDEMPIDIRQVLRLGYLAVAAITVVYQGGMALYYLGRRPAVEAALSGTGPA